MRDIERSFERLRRANPNPTRPIDDKPTAYEFLAEDLQPERLRRPELVEPRQWRRGVLVAAAVFVVAVLVALPMLLFLSRGDDQIPVATDPPVPTSVPATTVPATSTASLDAVDVFPGFWDHDTFGIFEFTAAGEFFVRSGGEVVDQGTYQIIGKLLTFRSAADSPTCPGGIESYEYFVNSADSISINFGVDTLVTGDTCITRLSRLDGTELTRTDPPAALDAAAQADVDRFVEIYNTGDADAFLALLSPDFRREIRRDRDDTILTLETVRALFEIDASLNTELTLICRPLSASVQCETQRSDALHRVLSIPATSGWAWRLTFENGLLQVWAETRFNQDTEYDANAVRPFTAWVRENRPDVGELSPFVGGEWITREGIADEMAALVDEWAASLGVTLEE